MRWLPRRKYKAGQTIKVSDSEVTLPLWLGLIASDGTEASWPGYRRQPMPRLAREIFRSDFKNLDELGWDIGGDFDIVAFGIFDTKDSPRARQIIGVWVNSARKGDKFSMFRGAMDLAEVNVNRLIVEDGDGSAT